LVTINNNSNNRIVTATGVANTLDAEANLTFDGTTLSLIGSFNISGLTENASATQTIVVSGGTFYYKTGAGISSLTEVGGGVSIISDGGIGELKTLVAGNSINISLGSGPTEGALIIASTTFNPITTITSGTTSLGAYPDNYQHRVYLIDASSGNVTVDLAEQIYPDVVHMTFKRIDSGSNLATLSGVVAGVTIEGATTALIGNKDSVTLVYSSGYHII
jgi:hypothetical protein